MKMSSRIKKIIACICALTLFFSGINLYQIRAEETVTGYDLELAGFAWENADGSSDISKGDTVTFTAAIRNNSNVDIPSGTSIELEILIDGNSQKASYVFSDGFKAGKVNKLAFNEKWIATTGGHEVVATVDPSNTLANENSEDNNSVTKSFNVTEKINTSYTPVTGGYDLVVTDVTWSPESVSAGTAVTFSATIVNAGDTDIPAGEKLGVQFQINGNTSDITWNDLHYDGLKAGEAVTLTANGGTNASTWKPSENGTYTITAWVNDTNKYSAEVGGYQASNNKKTVELTIPYSVEYVENPDAPDDLDKLEENKCKYTVEYYYDNVKDDTKTESDIMATYGDTITYDKDAYTGKDKTGYKYVGATSITIGTGKNVIRVDYERDSFPYTVEYYYDGEIDDSKTYTADEKKLYGAFVDEYKDAVIDGYVFDKVEGTTITEVAANNIVRVYYEKGQYPYSIEYYYDGVKDDSKTVTDLEATFDDFVTYNKTEYTNKEKYGYIYDRATSIKIGIEDNVIKVYYKRNIFTVKFNYNGGIKSTANKSVQKGKKYGNLPVAQRKGYKFNGWYTQRTGGKKVSNNTIVNLTTDQTLYAHWSKITVSKNIKVSSIRQKKGKISLKVSNAKNASGYVIYCSYNKKFKKAKKIDVTGKKRTKKYIFTVKKVLTKAKQGRTYYYRVRPYIIDSAGKKVWGKYGKTYSILYRNK